VIARWRVCDSIRLLENGDEFYAAAFSAIDSARREIFVETFILQEDKVGQTLAKGLKEAAARGVHVELTIDGYGSPDLSSEFTSSLVKAGVHLNLYDHRPRSLGFRTNVFHRLHRNLLVVDGTKGFVGVINF
jgi:cardiolipin synthase